MTCTLRILLNGRESARWDRVTNLRDPAFQSALKASIQELRRRHRKVAVTAIIAGVEHVIYSGRSA